jgi:hypothetical protein
MLRLPADNEKRFDEECEECEECEKYGRDGLSRDEK